MLADFAEAERPVGINRAPLRRYSALDPKSTLQRFAYPRVAVNGVPRWARRPSHVTGCFSAEHPVGLFTVRTRRKIILQRTLRPDF